jgi:hypothetical protein
MCDQSSVCCYQRISVPIVNFIFGMRMLFYFKLSFQSLLERRSALCPWNCGVLSAFNYQLSVFDQGSAIFDFKHLLDTGTILWIVVWILSSTGRSSISWAEQCRRCTRSGRSKDEGRRWDLFGGHSRPRPFAPDCRRGHCGRYTSGNYQSRSIFPSAKIEIGPNRWYNAHGHGCDWCGS